MAQADDGDGAREISLITKLEADFIAASAAIRGQGGLWASGSRHCRALLHAMPFFSLIASSTPADFDARWMPR